MRWLIMVMVLSFLEVGHSCKKKNLQRCTKPQGETGDKVTDGCLQRICKAGVWEKSLATNLCCYERTPYNINTTISSNRDGCVWAAINCVEEAPGIAKTIFSMENFCKKKDDLYRQAPEEEGKEDKDILYRDHNQILQLPSFTPLPNCKVPKPQSPNFYTVTTVINGQLTMCGGIYWGTTTYHDTCFTLSNGSWVGGLTPHMIKKRAYAAHSWTRKGLFVTGGYNKEDDWLSHTEYLTRSNKWEEGPRLPQGLKGHCQVTVGSDVYIIGGSNDRSMYGFSEVWKLSDGACDWSYVNSMLQVKTYHLCAVHENYIYALAGTFSYNGYGVSERMNLLTMTWEKVPDLPDEYLKSGQLFSYQSSLYVAGQISGVVVRLTSDNKWEEITTLGSVSDDTGFPAPLVTKDVLGC